MEWKTRDDLDHHALRFYAYETSMPMTDTIESEQNVRLAS